MANQSLPVITISRQSGSQGREAGRLLAQKLNIPYYDYEILDRAAKESGLSPELFEQAEHSAAASLDRLEKGLPATDTPINVKLFQAQAQIIRELAQEGPAVIVGRCGDSVLKGTCNLVSVYIYASEERRIQNVIRKKGLSRPMTQLFIRQIDKGRSAYHNFFSQHAWGDMAAYDLCVCTDQLTPEETADTIAAFVAVKSKGSRES